MTAYRKIDCPDADPGSCPITWTSVERYIEIDEQVTIVHHCMWSRHGTTNHDCGCGDSV